MVDEVGDLEVLVVIILSCSKDVSEFLRLLSGFLFLFFGEPISSSIAIIIDFITKNVCFDGVYLDIVLLFRNIHIRQRPFDLKNEDLIDTEIFQSEFNGFKFFFR